MSSIYAHLPMPYLSDASGSRPKVFEDELRGCKAIAEYRYGDQRYWRRVSNLCSKGRFPCYTDGGSIYCARKSTIDRLIALQEYYGLLGRKWTAKDVAEHFGAPATLSKKAKAPDLERADEPNASQQNPVETSPAS